MHALFAGEGIRVKRLSKEELDCRLGRANQRFRSLFPNGYVTHDTCFSIFKREGRCNTPLDEPTQIVNAFVFQLGEAVCRVRKIVHLDMADFAIEVTDSQRGFQTACGALITASELYLRAIQGANDDGSVQFETTSIRAGFFHELIHIFTESTDELLPLLAQFLYDPKNEEFNKIAKELVDEYRLWVYSNKRPSNYSIAWMKACRFLVAAIKTIEPGLAIPRYIDGQLRLVEDLPHLYSGVSEEARNEIIRSALEIPMEEIDQKSRKLGRILCMRF